LIGSAPIGVSKPSAVAMSSIFCSGSIARIKSIGDKGLCIGQWQAGKPNQTQLIGLTGLPLTIILEVVVLHIKDNMSLHRWPKPSCCTSSSIYSYMSNAFVMSNFSSNISFGIVKMVNCSLNILEVVMYVFSPDEGTLAM
jgi:hypothetical protein